MATMFARLVENAPSSYLYCIGHWYNLHDAITKYGANYFKKNDIKLINLIRHPIDRTHSNWHNLRTYFSRGMPEDHQQGFTGSIKNQEIWLTDFLRDHCISLDKTEDVTFIGACLNLFGCSIDIRYKNCEHVTIESLNNDTFIKLIKNISNGKILLEKQEIDEIAIVKNSHVAAFYKTSENKDQYEEKISTFEKYESWLPWQQKLYQICITKSQLNKYYKKYNYELYI